MIAPKRALSFFAIGLALALAFFIVPTVTDSGQKASAEWPYTLIYYDGHMHSNRSDGEGSVKEIAATARERGLDVVIITDHCKDLRLAEWQSLVAETAAVSVPGEFLALPGFEITGNEGALLRDHMNAYNAPDPFVGDDALELCPEEKWPDPANPDGTGPNVENLTKWVDYVHSQGGIVNHNHPSGDTRLEYGVNNVEVYNQGHVDDIMGYALELGVPADEAWGFAISINNFALYGETSPEPYLSLNELVWFPGIPIQVSLRYALWAATAVLTGVGQVVGWGPFNPLNPPSPGDGDLNSWDDLLMAYVNGEVEKPTFAVANTDAHNTGDLCYFNEDGTAQADGEGTCCDKTEGEPIENDSPPDGANGEDPECIEAIDRYEPWEASGIGVAKNGLYVLALTPTQVYNAIKAGRSFATTGPSLAFDVNGMLMGSTAYIPKGGSANLNLSVNSESPTAVLAKIDIIKNGQVVQTINPLSPTYAGTLAYPMTERGYYRVEVTSVDVVSGAYQFAYSNPVFVKCPFDKDCDGYLDLIEKLLGSNPDDATSTPEHFLVPGTCKDGLDNDKDGLIDTADRGCPWAW